MYMPTLKPHSAVNQMMLWIAFNQPLQEALKETGYKKRNRILTPRQVELIFEYLGEP